MSKALYNRDQYFRYKLHEKVEEGMCTSLKRWRDEPEITGGKNQLILSFSYVRMTSYVRSYYIPFNISVKKHRSLVIIKNVGDSF